MTLHADQVWWNYPILYLLPDKDEQHRKYQFRYLEGTVGYEVSYLLRDTVRNSVVEG